jgi:eukaryotic-like serine/threonine-protein kinase
LLVGEPGIGKSRLADEVTRRARSRGADVVVGRCWEAGGAPAYWPWVQSLRACTRDAEPKLLRGQMGAGAVDLAQLLPELRELFPDLPVPPALDSAAARFRLFDATARFLSEVSTRRPLVIVLDDLHAADASSLLLLQFLGRELATSRILVIAAYRDVDPVPGTALISTIAELVREPTTLRLSLTGLNEREVEEYLERTAAELATADLVASLHAETEGNPLFVAETVRLLTQTGDRPATHEALVIPQSVRDVISRRLARLSNECNRALQLASLLGREFAPAALARLNQSTEDTLLDTLDEAACARVISEVPGSINRLRFTHVLIRDTLYEGLTKTRRVQLHRRTLGALEALYGDEPGPHLAELAHHAVAGGDLQRALLYAQRAGDHALALLAYEEAVRLYQLGLDQLEPGGGSQRERCELLLALGHAQVRAGEAAAGKDTFLQAAEIARRLALPEELARAALGYGGRFAWARAGGDQRLVPLLREALALANGLEVPLRARLIGRLAAALGDEPEGDERAKLSEEAVAMARRVEDGPTLAYTLVARFSAIWSPTTVHERLAIASEVVELAERIRDKERAVEGHGFRFNALMELGEVETADADLAARGRLTNEMRQPAQRWVHLVLETTRSIFLGKFDAAEETLREAFELREARGAGALDAFELQRFLLRRERGGLTEIESALESAASTHPTRPLLRFATASLLAELDRSEKARRQLAEFGGGSFTAVPFNSDWLLAAAFAARLRASS